MIYNTIGSLTTLKSHLEHNNIYDFNSVKDVIEFQKSYTFLRQQLISHHETLIEQEKKMLKIALENLDITVIAQKQKSVQRLTDEIDRLKEELGILTAYQSGNIFQKLLSGLKSRNCKKKIKYKEQNFDSEVKMSINNLIENFQIKSNRYEFISSHVNEAIRSSAQFPLSELERKKTIVDGLNSFIYGALGEQKVVKTLESLSDEYFLINDFAVSLSPGIYHRQENDCIKSVQIDHILIGPSGVFLIETKNWSEKSLANMSLHSPVKQIKRANFLLFKLLNSEMSKFHLHLDSHHWGDKKISIRNLIVLTNTKPKEEFQYVKILTINELLRYVNYFKPSFSNDETQRIAEFLVNLNNQKTIHIN